MRLTLSVFDSDELIPLEISTSMSVRDFKAFVACETNIPNDEIKLELLNEVVEGDHLLLSNWDFQRDDIIVVKREKKKKQQPVSVPVHDLPSPYSYYKASSPAQKRVSQPPRLSANVKYNNNNHTHSYSYSSGSGSASARASRSGSGDSGGSGVATSPLIASKSIPAKISVPNIPTTSLQYHKRAQSSRGRRSSLDQEEFHNQLKRYLNGDYSTTRSSSPSMASTSKASQSLALHYLEDPNPIPEKVDDFNTPPPENQLDAEIERLRLQSRLDPNLREQLFGAWPDLMYLTHDPILFKQAMVDNDKRRGSEKQSIRDQIIKLNANPYDPENSEKLMEFIRQDQIADNLNQSLNIPKKIVATYIHLEINGIIVKASVSTSDLLSSMSLQCVEKCSMLQIIDPKVKLRQSMIGKIWAAPVRINNSFISVAFNILEDQEIDVKLGLDMLKRYKGVLDFHDNALKFGDDTQIPFLTEEEILEPDTVNTKNVKADTGIQSLQSKFQSIMGMFSKKKTIVG